MENSPDNRRVLGPPDLEGVVSDYFYRNRDGYREHVRRRDDFVVSRTWVGRVPRKESVRKMPSQNIVPASESVKARHRAFEGNKYNALTIKELLGQGADNGNAFVRATCDCGKVIEGFRTEMVQGKKPCCGKGCPEAHKYKKHKKVGRPRGRRKGNEPSPAAAETEQDRRTLEAAVEIFSPSAPIEVLRSTLEDEARLLRRTAVGLIKGLPTPLVAQRMREQADKIDEVLYS